MAKLRSLLCCKKKTKIDNDWINQTDQDDEIVWDADMSDGEVEEGLKNRNEGKVENKLSKD